MVIMFYPVQSGFVSALHNVFLQKGSLDHV